MSSLLQKAFSSDGEISIKRIVGVFGILFYMSCIVGTFLGSQLTSGQQSLLENLLYVCGGLLGVGVLDGFGRSRGVGRSYNYMGDNSSNTVIDNPKQMEENK